MSKYWKIFIGCVVALLAAVFLLALYAVEKPNPTLDYFTQYNDLTRPDPYDPKQDAAEVLKKLPEQDFGGMLLMHTTSGEVEDVEFSTYDYEIADFPQEFSAEDLQKLEKWLVKKQSVLDTIVQASQKPYYCRPADTAQWKTLTLQYGSFLSDNSDFFDITGLLSWATAYHLHRGDFETAARYIQASLDLYRLMRPNAVYYRQYEVASFIDELSFLYGCIQNENISSDTLRSLQQLLQAAEVDCGYDDTVARLCFQDCIQKYYTPGDHGHLAPLVCVRRDLGGFSWSASHEILKRFNEAFNGSRRKKAVDRMESIFARLNALKDLPVSTQLAEVINLQTETQALAGDCTIVQEQAGYLLSQFRLPYQSACTLQALAAAIALERYRRDKGQYPESFETLLVEGFVDRLPEDTFSGKPLIYRRQDSSYLLYSVGVDGEDDGGLPALCRNCGDPHAEWGDGPVFRAGSPADLDPADPKDAFADHIFRPDSDPDRAAQVPPAFFEPNDTSGVTVF